MNKIPIPMIVTIVVIALIALFFSLRMSGVMGSSEKVPTGPPAEAMEKIRSYQRH